MDEKKTREWGIASRTALMGLSTQNPVNEECNRPFCKLLNDGKPMNSGHVKSVLDPACQNRHGGLMCQFDGGAPNCSLAYSYVDNYMYTVHQELLEC